MAIIFNPASNPEAVFLSSFEREAAKEGFPVTEAGAIFIEGFSSSLADTARKLAEVRGDAAKSAESIYRGEARAHSGLERLYRIQASKEKVIAPLGSRLSRKERCCCKRKKYFLRLALVVLTAISPGLPSHAFASDRMGPTERSLIEIIRANRIDRLKEFVNQNADVIHEEYRGRTVLTLAVAQGRNEMVKFLLESGADPNQGKTSRKTPIEELLSSTTFKSLSKSPSADEIEDLRRHLNTLILLLDYGADYQFSYTHKGESGMVFRNWIIDDVVNTVCDKRSFVRDLSSEVYGIAGRINPVELDRARRSQFIKYAMTGGFISRDCAAAFGIR